MKKRKRIAVLEVPLSEHRDRELFLKTALVEAEYRGIKMSVTYSGAGLHFCVDKKYYLMQFDKIIEAVYQELISLGKLKKSK